MTGKKDGHVLGQKCNLLYVFKLYVAYNVLEPYIHIHLIHHPLRLA